MDTQLKKAWVEALRGGEYRQGRFALYKPYTEDYCCLGVLCVVAGKKCYPRDGYDWMHTILPGGFKRFTDMNDREGKTFNEIADYIETNL